LNTTIDSDPEIKQLIIDENNRQQDGLELIASENFAPVGVLQCLGSILTNKYAEGLPGKRYYGGTNIIDKIESLCISRALSAFHLDPLVWGVNVQPYSGSIANFAVYNALLLPNDKLMGLDLPSGGHLTHGFQTETKKISTSSIYFNSQPYYINNSGFIDYDRLELDATEFKPKMLVIGYSAYSRDLNYARFKQIADINNSYLVCDMAHFNGFVSTGLLASPFDYCDIVTTTTHKTLGGPRAGLIFFKKKYEKLINNSVFPSIQGGPHENQICAVAHQLKYVMSPQYKEYMIRVKKNAHRFSKIMMDYGYNVLTGGTDNHIILIDLKDTGVSGSKMERICEYVGISINKNSVFSDKSALTYGGIRVGTSAMTTRGLQETHITIICDFFHRLIQLSRDILKNINLTNESAPKVSLRVFEEKFESELELDIIKNDVKKFANLFPYYNFKELYI
jgi:glycine hydroxymethyltransferase